MNVFIRVCRVVNLASMESVGFGFFVNCPAVTIDVTGCTAAVQHSSSLDVFHPRLISHGCPHAFIHGCVSEIDGPSLVLLFVYLSSLNLGG